MSDSMIGMILLVVFIIINAVMYGFGEACRKVGANELEKKSAEGSSAAKKVLAIIDNPRKFIRTVHVSTMLMAIAIGYYQVRKCFMVIEHFFVEKWALYFTHWFIDAVAYIIVALYLILLMLAIGVIIPKRLGSRYSLAWSLALVRPVRIVMFILTPFTALVSFFANLILRIFGIDPNEDSDNVTEEEIVSIVNEGHEQGVLLASEAEMINNIIEFSDKDAGDIMTHRKSIIAADGERTLRETVEYIVSESNSRFPVYVENIDNIIGIIHIRDVVEYFYKGENPDTMLKDAEGLVRKVEFIPETRSIDRLFKEMQTSKEHMKIVVDEYGQTAGLITMEDILEEIVGNILDEYDEEENNIMEDGEDTYIIKGSTPLEEITDKLEIEFDEDDYDTLNGYLISKLDRIPDDNDKATLDIDGNIYEVLAVENKMISSVRLKVNRSDADGEEDSDDDEEKNSEK